MAGHVDFIYLHSKYLTSFHQRKHTVQSNSNEEFLHSTGSPANNNNKFSCEKLSVAIPCESACPGKKCLQHQHCGRGNNKNSLCHNTHILECTHDIGFQPVSWKFVSFVVNKSGTIHNLHVCIFSVTMQ